MPFDIEKGAFARPKTNRRLFTLSALFLLTFLSLYTIFNPRPARIEFRKQGSFALPLPKWTTQDTPPAPSIRTHPACEIWPGWRTAVPQPAPMDHDALDQPSLGSPEFFGGSRQHACVPASERLTPFGRVAGEPEQLPQDGDDQIKRDSETPDWSSLHWGALQSGCAAAHFETAGSIQTVLDRRLERSPAHLQDFNGTEPTGRHERNTGRTAVVLRTWDSYQYTDNQKAWLRALIAELAMDTGGEFQVFLLVNVKDDELDLLGDEDLYQQTLAESVPSEFRDMALLYNTQLLAEWYPLVDEHGAQDQMYQALQIFSHTFPEFDYLWQIEMDLRFTGNVAEMLTSAGRWAATQPRRNLWERNAQFYLPALWNDSYPAFAAHVDAEMADDGIWGPAPRARFFVDPVGPTPPPRSRTSWGVGEPAELLTLAPLIDPAGTLWTYEHTVHNWGRTPATRAVDSSLPRRMAMVSVTRTSRRLLRTVSAAQRATGAWLVSEATPETFALLHGLKAVYVPHYVAFAARAGGAPADPASLDTMVHAGPAWSRAGGERAGFLYCAEYGALPEQRWLDASYFYWAGRGEATWRAYVDGACGPPMVLHPVKNE